MSLINHKQLYFIIIYSTSILSGCATLTQTQPSDHPSTVPVDRQLNQTSYEQANNKIPVTISRESGALGLMMNAMLIIDEQPVALLKTEEKTTVYLTPGRHQFAIGYIKNPDSRPLVQRDFLITPDQNNTIYLRLFYGREPVFFSASDPDRGNISQSTQTMALFQLPPCFDNAEVSANISDVYVKQGKVCFGERHHQVATMAPTWFDLGNLQEYADPAQVQQIVEFAMDNVAFSYWVIGASGKGMDENQRYIYTRKAGWIDLKHVISATSNPTAFIPVVSRFGPWFIEVAQLYFAPMSAFKEEDVVSNHIGADAALQSLIQFGQNSSRAAIIHQVIQELEPLSREEALAFFGVMAFARSSDE